MSMFSAFDVTASGLTAQRLRMDVISENVANANTTRTEDGTPYRRKIVTFQQKGQQQTFSQVLHNVSSSYTGSGVKVSQIFEDTTTELNMVYDPSHPDADENGYVTYPNVNIVQEMTDNGSWNLKILIHCRVRALSAPLTRQKIKCKIKLYAVK